MPEAAPLGTARFERSPTALWRRLEGRVVVCGQHAGAQPLVLNDSGALVWDLLDRPRTLDQLVDELRVVRTGTPSVISNDLVELLRELEARDVVVTR